jgi:hypothetical protein
MLIPNISPSQAPVGRCALSVSQLAVFFHLLFIQYSSVIVSPSSLERNLPECSLWGLYTMTCIQLILWSHESRHNLSKQFQLATISGSGIRTLVQQVKQLLCKPGDLSSIPRAYITEGETRLHKCVLWSPYVCLGTSIIFKWGIHG